MENQEDQYISVFMEALKNAFHVVDKEWTDQLRYISSQLNFISENYNSEKEDANYLEY